MTGNEMEKVIDKLAEKIGVTADKIQPIAEEVIKQVQDRAFVMIIFLLCVIIFIIVTSLIIEKKVEKHAKGRPLAIGGMLILPCLIILGSQIGTYIAPLAKILGV